jgi:hypothetical protein
METSALLNELPDSISYNGEKYYLSFFRADGWWCVEYVNNKRLAPRHTLVYVERKDFVSRLKELVRRLRQGKYLN